ncbi:M23 family metallopeptidase [Auraticoccus cholistanensis]|uniref:M23 family metallopeptidase n=1 Tax=Auraticoccus cholistanensis TaxID=2656650 RepID=UPI0012E92E51
MSPRSILSHGLAALAISVLGLGVAGSVSLTSAAQSTQVDARASLTADNPDVTRAEPATKAAGLSVANQAAVQQSQASTEDPTGESGTLDSFSGRDARETRNSVRAELDRAIAAKQVAERASELSKLDEEVVTSSRKAIQDDRAKELQATGQEIEEEDERIKAEEKRKAEERKRKAEQATGTLVSPQSAAPAAEDYEFEGELGKGGGAAPIASGSYSIAARWGAVGSWSRYHTGIDLSAPIGTPIRAAADGVVVSPASGAGWAGVHVVIKHADGSHTLYAHMASTAVQPGQQVKAGDLVGVVGMTGRTFGPHLHFEWYPAGTTPGDVYSSKDPYVWMLALGVRL